MKHEHRRRSSPAPLVVGALTLATLMAAVAILDVDVEASHRSNASRIASDATSRTTSQAVQAPPSLPPEPTSTSAPATTTSPPARARRIAFSSNRNWPDGPLALFTMNPDGTDITLVVAYSQSHGDEGPVEPSWSPDQSHLAYTLAPTINKNPPCSYNRTIYISDSAGGAQRQLLTTRTCGTYDHQATWSPDGTLIAYVETSARGPIISQLRAVRPEAPAITRSPPLPRTACAPRRTTARTTSAITSLGSRLTAISSSTPGSEGPDQGSSRSTPTAPANSACSPTSSTASSTRSATRPGRPTDPRSSSCATQTGRPPPTSTSSTRPGPAYVPHHPHPILRGTICLDPPLHARRNPRRPARDEHQPDLDPRRHHHRVRNPTDTTSKTAADPRSTRSTQTGPRPPGSPTTTPDPRSRPAVTQTPTTSET